MRLVSVALSLVLLGGCSVAFRSRSCPKLPVVDGFATLGALGAATAGVVYEDTPARPVVIASALAVAVAYGTSSVLGRSRCEAK